MGAREVVEFDHPELWYVLESSGLVRLEMRHRGRVAIIDTLPYEILPAAKRAELKQRREIMTYVVEVQ